MDDTSCMVDVAKFFMQFCMTESCGKCVPCRVGTVHLHGILDCITKGESSQQELDTLESLCDMVKETSLCGLGQGAPNPVVSTLKFFRGEYLAHIMNHTCPAGVCAPAGQDLRRPQCGVVTLTIDGRAVSGCDDETVLAVSRENEIEIPTLCQLDGLSIWGGCRLCLVEIDGRAKLQTACTTLVCEDMVVRTDTPKLRNYRKTIIEMLFTEGNHVCSVCVSNGNCELQHTAQALEVDHISLPYLYPKRSVDATHPLFDFDANRCILCTRCVRVCDEVEGAHTWDVQGRGIESKLITDFGQPWGDATSCTSCGKCVQSLPHWLTRRKGQRCRRDDQRQQISDLPARHEARENRS